MLVNCLLQNVPHILNYIHIWTVRWQQKKVFGVAPKLQLLFDLITFVPARIVHKNLKVVVPEPPLEFADHVWNSVQENSSVHFVVER